MNSIFKLITNQQIPETANALVPVIGYEPWSLRALESIKSSIVNGVPTLIRVHSAADYPIENEELSHRLDMESHCVLIVGYNDDKEEFDIVDPWNPNWGGQHGGVGKLPYESLHVACVNCTAEKGTRLSLISHKIRPVLIEENASLAVDLGFYEPLGYVIDRNNTKFETFKVTIHYLFNGNEKQQLIPIESKEGIKVMSLNFLVQSESDPVIWRGPVIGGVVKQFYTDVVWGDLDVLLIDMPPGTGDVALTIMQSIPVQGVVMVSTPQPMVSMIVEKACHMCEKMEVKVLGIIENMAYLECPNCHERIEFYKKEDVETLCNSTCTKLYGTLPMLDLIRDINEYDAYSKEQQEKVDAYVSDIATEVLEDIA